MRPSPPRPPRLTAAAPLIGIVTHALRVEDEPGMAVASGRPERDLAPKRLELRLSYTQAVQDAGGLAVVLPAHGYANDVDALLRRVDGLLFSGGPDIDPAVYAQERHPELGPDVDRASDEYELALLDGAVQHDVPVLGICRGMQALNVARGGTLHQHLPDVTALAHRQGNEPQAPAHPVVVEPRSLLHRVSGATALAVNSLHHQGVDRIGAGLEACAHAPDGTVEAVWDPAARFCLGVQWHAELLAHHESHAALFGGLVAAAAQARRKLALVA